MVHARTTAHFNSKRVYESKYWNANIGAQSINPQKLLKWDVFS